MFLLKIYDAKVVSVNRTVIRIQQEPDSLRRVLEHESAGIIKHRDQGDREESVSAPILEWDVLARLKAYDP